MNEPNPSGFDFSEYPGPRWNRPDLASDWQDWSDTETETIDYDAIPTLAELQDGARTGPVVSLINAPHAIALPDIYEPRYAYPVVVWFHAAGGTEEDLFEVLPQISDRNYLGLALRGDVPQGAGATWSLSGRDGRNLLQDVEEAVHGLAQRFRIHPERVYLAGVGAGGSAALELALQHPEAFAGAACLCGSFPAIEYPLARFRGLRGRRVLLSTAVDCRDVKIADLVAAGRLLYTAGMQVGTRVYQSMAALRGGKMLRDLDHWIMDAISSAVKVSSR